MRNQVLGSIAVFLFVFAFSLSFAVSGQEVVSAPCAICDCYYNCQCPFASQLGWYHDGQCTDKCRVTVDDPCLDRCNENLPPC